MNILALDTATDVCSVALQVDDQQRIDHRDAPQQHAQLVLPMIDALLSDAGITVAQLDAIAFGRGPGSFTGLRIAAAVTQGLAFGADVPVVPVSTLQALAQGLNRTVNATHCVVALDARMQEIYAAVYAVGEASADGDPVMQLIGNEQLCAAAEFDHSMCASSANWFFAGTGIDAYLPHFTAVATAMNASLVQHQQPNAQDLLNIAIPRVAAGDVLPAEQAIPVYLRDRVALTEQQRAEGQRL